MAKGAIAATATASGACFRIVPSSFDVAFSCRTSGELYERRRSLRGQEQDRDGRPRARSVHGELSSPG